MAHSAENLEAGAAQYGAVDTQKIFGRHSGPVKRPERKPVGISMVIGCVVVPWFIFVITYYTMAFFIRYWAAYVAFAVAGITLLACFGFAFMTYKASMGSGGDPLWLGLLCILGLVGWTWAMIGGDYTFSNFMQPYMDLQQLNVYESVNPSQSQGNQYMDFGVMNFVMGTQIDREFSMGFKNDDTYCVAPIKVAGAKPSTYDFWAVGLNCCSQHLSDFRCGEYNNPVAHSGLRVLLESQKSFYTLAAKQAAAAFNIEVSHPVFFEWVSDPKVQIQGLQEDAFRMFMTWSFYFFAVEVAAVILVAWAFSKA